MSTASDRIVKIKITSFNREPNERGYMQETNLIEIMEAAAGISPEELVRLLKMAQLALGVEGLE